MREGAWLSSERAYLGFLRRTHRFHRNVESELRPYAADLEATDWEWRPRSPFLEADLRDLEPLIGDEPSWASGAVDRSERITVEDAAGALGVLYVIEGSALGGRVLAGWIEARFGFNGSFGASSFVPYGADTRERWRAFGELAERAARLRPDHVATMVGAARATFRLHATTVGPAVDRQLTGSVSVRGLLGQRIARR